MRGSNNKLSKKVLRSMGGKFLGQTTTLSDVLSEKEKHACASVNGYLKSFGGAGSIPLKQFNIRALQLGGFQSTFSLTTKDNVKYYPLTTVLNIKGMHCGDQFLWMEGLGRPNTDMILLKLAEILKEEYPGCNQIQAGRYVYCIDKFPLTLQEMLLQQAKIGKGDHIDYSWIAPLLELVVSARDKVKVLKKQLTNSTFYKTGLDPYEDADVVDEVDDDYEPPVPKNKPTFDQQGIKAYLASLKATNPKVVSKKKKPDGVWYDYSMMEYGTPGIPVGKGLLDGIQKPEVKDEPPAKIPF